MLLANLVVNLVSLLFNKGKFPEGYKRSIVMPLIMKQGLTTQNCETACHSQIWTPLEYLRKKREVRDQSITGNLSLVKAHSFQARGDDRMFLGGWKFAQFQRDSDQSSQERSQLFNGFLKEPCGHWIAGTLFVWGYSHYGMYFIKRRAWKGNKTRTVIFGIGSQSSIRCHSSYPLELNLDIVMMVAGTELGAGTRTIPPLAEE